MVCCLKYSSQYRFLNWNAFLDSVNSVIICLVITYIVTLLPHAFIFCIIMFIEGS